MAYLLAADIGGTKTLLQLSTAAGEVILAERYHSPDYPDFEQMLSAFLRPINDRHEITACFAVAGPVQGTSARVTNLPWQLNSLEIKARFDLKQVILCNDFEAVGQGIESLTEVELMVLQAGQERSGPRAVIGAGTGLGQAYLIAGQNGWQVYPTEGGHVDFAPVDRTQLRLFEHLLERFGHVSYERVLSGQGLVTIYNFLRDYRQLDENPECRLAMVNDDGANAISVFARQGDPLAREAMMMFFDIYGAQAGNLALTVMPGGGLYIAGGIAAKNLELLEQSNFINAFNSKGRMQDLMQAIPVKLIMQPEVGLNGARLLAAKAMYN
ncbi:glucokinase [Methylophaga sp.]|uniref:glucokinase n=1 Tax=Methylophaga sp. TaxID=2024840 RepID=UPI0014009F9A|nr:glucokinase [Methylophaga sp.]MTI63175.1 glucokinase [Methylophaga sp.]